MHDSRRARLPWTATALLIGLAAAAAQTPANLLNNSSFEALAEDGAAAVSAAQGRLATELILKIYAANVE